MNWDHKNRTIDPVKDQPPEVAAPGHKIYYDRPSWCGKMKRYPEEPQMPKNDHNIRQLT
jgi:hypothetical protein